MENKNNKLKKSNKKLFKLNEKLLFNDFKKIAKKKK